MKTLMFQDLAAMENQHLKASLELIQALLDCPKGEEWNLLQQHQDLISPELLQVMHGVANQFASEGKVNQAKFLRQWEAQLVHLLQATPQATGNDPQVRTEAYLNLIQALLECPKGGEPEIFANHPDLIDPGLVQMMQQVSAQLAAKGNQDVAIYLRHLAADIARMLQETATSTIEPPHSAPSPFPELASERPPARQPQTTPALATIPEPQPSGEQGALGAIVSEGVAAIVQTLNNLEAIISAHLQPVNPLWSMEILERAYQHQWVISSEQVEQLIGIKPHCSNGQNTFHCNGWTFVKVLPLGAHLGWRVGKEAIDLTTPSGATKTNAEKRPNLHP